MPKKQGGGGLLGGLNLGEALGGLTRGLSQALGQVTGALGKTVGNLTGSLGQVLDQVTGTLLNLKQDAMAGQPQAQQQYSQVVDLLRNAANSGRSEAGEALRRLGESIEPDEEDMGYEESEADEESVE